MIGQTKSCLLYTSYAEVLLNHAEACYHLNGYTDKANKDIKDIRNRVGLSYTDKSGDDLDVYKRQGLYFLFGDSLGVSSLFLLVFFLFYVFCCAVSILSLIHIFK